MELNINAFGLPDYGKPPDPIDWSIVLKTVCLACVLLIIINALN